MEYEFTAHARDMLKEREIPEEWVERTVDDPRRVEEKDDGTVHYLRSIAEHGGRWLRVVVNPKVDRVRIITLFFDRRVKRVS